jgi:transcriptional regulator with XRE-family HTH domain
VHAGMIVRSARQARNMTLAELGAQCGYSAAQLSRYERGLAPLTDITTLRAFAGVLNIPPADLGLAPDRRRPGAPGSADVRFFPPCGRSVVEDGGEEDDPVRRRSVLTLAGLAAPAAVLGRMDEALVSLPTPRSVASPDDMTRMLARAGRQFDDGRLAPLVRELPDLLAAGHDLVDRSPSDEKRMALLARSYDLASETLHKAGGMQAARITADRAVTYAGLSGDPLAQAMAARSYGVVLRHEGRQERAAQVTYTAAGRLAGTRLTSGGEASVLAQILCTSAYSAAQAGDRDRAISLIGEAAVAARHVRPDPGGSGRFPVTPAQVAQYKVGVHWSLGEPGEALRAGRELRPPQFPTAERRARLYTDLARVWDQAGHPDRAIAALLAAHGQAASEVRDRPSIRALALDLARAHPARPGADKLAKILSRAEWRQ